MRVEIDDNMEDFLSVIKTFDLFKIDYNVQVRHEHLSTDDERWSFYKQTETSYIITTDNDMRHLADCQINICNNFKCTCGDNGNDEEDNK